MEISELQHPLRPWMKFLYPDDHQVKHGTSDERWKWIYHCHEIMRRPSGPKEKEWTIT